MAQFMRDRMIIWLSPFTTIQRFLKHFLIGSTGRGVTLVLYGGWVYPQPGSTGTTGCFVQNRFFKGVFKAAVPVVTPTCLIRTIEFKNILCIDHITV